MNKTTLTAKELQLLNQLLIMEENACKKALLYGRTLTDPTVIETFNRIADSHKNRINALFALL